MIRKPIINPKESKLHVATAELLEAHCLPEWRWTFMNRKAKDAREGAIFKKMGLKPAWPDFVLLSPRCVFHGLELKRVGEGLGKGQHEFRRWALSHGGEYEVADSFASVLRILGMWGCLRIKTSVPVLSDC